MDNDGYTDYGAGDNGYAPGYDQAPQGGFGEYQDPNGYQQEGYTDLSQQAQEGFGDEYAQPQASASSSASLDDEWFNYIL